MKVAIVAVTRWGSLRCVGAINWDGESLRLLPSEYLPAKDEPRFHPIDTPFSEGDVWELDYSKSTNAKLPHSEDVIVRQSKKLCRLDNLRKFIVSKAKNLICKDDDLFDGTLLRSDGGSSYVSTANPCAYSTAFWICPCDLIREEDSWKGKQKIRYYLEESYPNISRLKYVGTLPSNEQWMRIPSGTLVRISLSGELDARFWLQLSGWYS